MENTELQVEVPNDNSAELVAQNAQDASTEANEQTEKQNLPEGSEESVENKPKSDEDDLPFGVKKRLGKLTARNKAYETQLMTQAQEINQLKTAMEEFVQSQKKPITRENFQDEGEYVRAVAAQAARDEHQRTVVQPMQMHQQAVQAQQDALQVWQEKVQETFEDTADFAKVVSSARVDMDPPVLNAIMQSDEGPRIAYWLAQNTDEAERISTLRGKDLDKAILKLELKLEGKILQQKQKPITRAPAPAGLPAPASVRSSGGPESTADFIARRRQQLRGKM